MSTPAKTRLKDWLTGPGDELISLPRWLSPTVWGFTIALDLIALFALAWFAWQFSMNAGQAVLALVSCVIYVVLLMVAVTSMILSLAHYADSPLSRQVIDDKSMIPRSFARAEIIALIVLVAISVTALVQ